MPTPPSPLPTGLIEVMKVFGDPRLFVNDKQAWEGPVLDMVSLKHTP
jgi:hypothetical protein